MQAAFYIITAVIIISAFMMVTRRNPINAAVWLLITFFGVAAIFALLGAHFIAAMQILLYAGAILVLFVFVIMLLNLDPVVSRWKLLSTRPFVFGSAAVYLFAVAGLSLWFIKAEPFNGPAVQGTIESIGRLLLTTYVVPFELTAVLLLVAIVGALTLVRKVR